MAGSPNAVLVVDDDPAILAFLEVLFEREGFEVIKGRNGREALEQFWANWERLALMVIDTEMPEMRGPEFVNGIPTLTRRIPVIFTVTEAEPDLRNLAQEGFPLLSKPFKPSALVEFLAANRPE